MCVNNKIILSELKDHLIKNYGNSVKDVVLFGSQARNDSNKFSDYDVLIIFDSGLKSQKKTIT